MDMKNIGSIEQLAIILDCNSEELHKSRLLCFVWIFVLFCVFEGEREHEIEWTGRWGGTERSWQKGKTMIKIDFMKIF